MSFDVRIDGGPRVVVSGELDIATSPELTSAIESLERTEAQRVVLDLSCDLHRLDRTRGAVPGQGKAERSTCRAGTRPSVSTRRNGAADLRTAAGVRPRGVLSLTDLVAIRDAAPPMTFSTTKGPRSRTMG